MKIDLKNVNLDEVDDEEHHIFEEVTFQKFTKNHRLKNSLDDGVKKSDKNKKLKRKDKRNQSYKKAFQHL